MIGRLARIVPAAAVEEFDPGPRALPVAFERALAATIAAVAIFGLGGLGLAMMGSYTALVAGIAAAGGAAYTLVAWGRDGPPAGRAALAATLLVLSAAGLIGAFNAAGASDTLIAGRDPGVYVGTGLWLSNHGDLTIDNERDAFPRGIEELRFEGPGFRATAEGGEALHAQFPHLYAVLLAGAAAIGGIAALLKATAVIGALSLLAIFALGARLMHPVLSAVGTIAFGLSYPFAYFTQTATSEVPAQLFVFGGAWLLLVARERRSLWLRPVAGLVLGAAAATRIDAYLVLIGLIAFLGWELIECRRAGSRPLGRAALGAALAGGGALVGAVMAWIDVRDLSPFYFAPLETRLMDIRLAAILATIGVVALVVAWPLLARIGWLLSPFHAYVASFAGLLFIVAGAYAYTLRPLVEVHTQANPAGVLAAIERLQEAAGESPDGSRIYSEEGARWIGLYLGGIAVLGAVVATGVAIRRQLLRPRAEWLLFLLVVLPLTILYVWRPQITPDQPWASRRYFTVAFPAVTLMFSAGAGWLAARRLANPWGAVGRLAAVGGLVVVLLTSAITARGISEENLAPLEPITADVCAALGDDATVLVHPPTASGREVVNFLSDRYAVIVRTACDLPTANVGALPPSSDYDLMAAHAEAQGRRFVVLSPSPWPTFGPLPGAVTKVAEDEIVVLRGVLNRRATEYDRQLFTAHVMPVPVTPGRLLDYGPQFDARELTSGDLGRWLLETRGELILTKNRAGPAVARIRLRALASPQRVSVRRGGREIAAGTVDTGFDTIEVPLGRGTGRIKLTLVASPGPENAGAVTGGHDTRRLSVHVLEDVEVAPERVSARR